MEINMNIIKINDKIKIKALDLYWLIIIPIININYLLASVLTQKGHDLTIKLDNIIPFTKNPNKYSKFPSKVGFTTYLGDTAISIAANVHIIIHISNGIFDTTLNKVIFLAFLIGNINAASNITTEIIITAVVPAISYPTIFECFIPQDIESS